MTDRELLELAAKAAGMESRWDHHRGWMRAKIPGDCAFPVWNPLADDGDALRLAVKLHIHVEPEETYAWASTLKTDAIENYAVSGNNPFIATRRAIVRAAAAIGEQA